VKISYLEPWGSTGGRVDLLEEQDGNVLPKAAEV
jgi:hypothetical protein